MSSTTTQIESNTIYSNIEVYLKSKQILKPYFLFEIHNIFNIILCAYIIEHIYMRIRLWLSTFLADVVCFRRKIDKCIIRAITQRMEALSRFISDVLKQFLRFSWMKMSFMLALKKNSVLVNWTKLYYKWYSSRIRN